MYRITPNPDVVIRIADSVNITRGHRWWNDYENWLADGNTPEPWETPEQATKRIQSELISAVQAHLDAAAREHGYDNIFTAATYADEPAVLKFQTEGQSFRAWRSHVWEYCYQVMADVQAGAIPAPTAEELVALLPELNL